MIPFPFWSLSSPTSFFPSLFFFFWPFICSFSSLFPQGHQHVPSAPHPHTYFPFVSIKEKMQVWTGTLFLFSFWGLLTNIVYAQSDVVLEM